MYISIIKRIYTSIFFLQTPKYRNFLLVIEIYRTKQHFDMRRKIHIYGRALNIDNFSILDAS